MSERHLKMRSLVPIIVKWDSEGKFVEGEVKSIDEFDNNKYDTQCKKYTLQKDGIMYTCVLGSAADDNLEGILHIGMNIRITYRGQSELESGRRVNVFEIVELIDCEKDENPVENLQQ